MSILTKALKKAGIILAFSAAAATTSHLVTKSQAVVTKNDVKKLELEQVFEKVSTYSQEAKDIEIKSISVDYQDKADVKPVITVNNLTPES